MPIGTSPNASVDATSLIVPSPPHAITRRAPRATAAFVSSRAWPARSVTKTSAGSPWRSTMADASSARARAISGRTPPEIGLMMKVISERSLLQGKVQGGLVARGEIGRVDGNSGDAIARACRRHFVALFHQKQLSLRRDDRRPDRGAFNRVLSHPDEREGGRGWRGGCWRWGQFGRGGQRG